MRKREYIRDKRSPVPKNEHVSKVMSANKAKQTIPEITLRKALYKEGIKGYRLNYKKIKGRPDIVFVSKKTAIFVHGCFWHRCPKCNYPMPKTNSKFWREKFEKNVKRDSLKTEQLEALGWKVVTVWECEIKEDIDKVVASIKTALK